MIRHATLTVVAVALAGLTAWVWAADPAPKASTTAPDKAAVERSRKIVRMLDGVYKQTIVLITDKYVNEDDDFAAGSAAVLLFKNISNPETQLVKLLDATGEPYEPENVAKDAFEKEGIKRIKAGAATYDEVVQQDGKYKLRAMTAVPVVMDKCIM
jgi:hypothetical protein